jgi:hypothetical protein
LLSAVRNAQKLAFGRQKPLQSEEDSFFGDLNPHAVRSYRITDGIDSHVRVLCGTPVLRHIRFCDLLGLCHQGPTLGQNEPRPSLVAIVAAVRVANAFSHFNATVVAFGHRYSMLPKAYQFLSRSF